MKKLKLLLVGATFAIATVGGLAAPAQAAELGGVSIWNACVYQHGTPSSVGTYAGYNVNGWRCRYDGGWNHIDKSVDLNQECRRVHGSSAYAAWTNYNDPYSWRCYR